MDFGRGDEQKVAGNGGKFVAALEGANKLAAGMYKLKVSAAATEGVDAVSEVLQLKVRVSLVVRRTQ